MLERNGDDDDDNDDLDSWWCVCCGKLTQHLIVAWVSSVDVVVVVVVVVVVAVRSVGFIWRTHLTFPSFHFELIHRCFQSSSILGVGRSRARSSLSV